MENRRFTIDTSQCDGATTLAIKGDLSIRHVTAIKHELLAHLSDEHHFHVYISEVSAMDISFLQLLLALKNESKKFRVVRFDIPSDLCNLIEGAGLDFLIQPLKE